MTGPDAIFDTSLGPVTLVAEAEHVTGLYFANHSPAPATGLFGERVSLPRDGLLAHVAQQVEEYLAGERTRFEVLAMEVGTPFQQRVWARMREVPYGETTTYGEIARALGNPGLARAVGGAAGHNPICILAPCHRILGADGALGGYAGGPARKRALLTLEGALS